jgi:hypothetical protein
MLQAIGLNLIGGFATYLVAKIASSGKNTPVVQETVSVAPAPHVPIVSTLPPAVRPAPVESKPPPAAPPPPVDRAPTLPTPPAQRPVAPVIAPPAAKPPVALPPVVEAPRPAAAVPSAPVEAAPPPPPPPPPPDVSATLPTPSLVPDGPEIDVPLGDKYAPGAPPAGFDPALARSLAPALAKNIAAKQYDFNRAQLKAFQTAAGVASDGVYGNDSWGALLYFTSDAPRALYKPSMPTPYPWGPIVARSAAVPAPAAAPTPSAPVTPSPVTAAPAAALPAPQSADVGPVPPPGFDPKLAQSMAKNVAKNIDTNKSSYSRPLVRNFQTAAGIASDGIYGGGTRRALLFYGIDRPPAALFKPTQMPAEYPWTSQANKVLK